MVCLLCLLRAICSFKQSYRNKGHISALNMIQNPLLILKGQGAVLSSQLMWELLPLALHTAGSSYTPVSRDWKGGVGLVRGGGFSTQPSGDTPAPRTPWDQPCHFISLSHATQVLCPTFWVRVSMAEVTCPGSQLAESSLRFTSATCPSQEKEPPLAVCGPSPPRLPPLSSSQERHMG